jgi:hypothetical protein
MHWPRSPGVPANNPGIQDMTMPELTSEDLKLTKNEQKFWPREEVTFWKNLHGTKYVDDNGISEVYDSTVVWVVAGMRWIRKDNRGIWQYVLRLKEPPRSGYGRFVNEYELQDKKELLHKKDYAFFEDGKKQLLHKKD